MSKIFVIGIRGKLFLVFTFIAGGLVFGGKNVFDASVKLQRSQDEQALAVGLFKSLKDISQVMSEANLLGMDIIVDHYENPTAKVVREGEFKDFSADVDKQVNVWRTKFEKAGMVEKFAPAESSVRSLLDTIGQLIAAINRGEKDPKVYAGFDESIDGTKEKGSEVISAIQEEFQVTFDQAQLNAQHRIEDIDRNILYLVLGCLGILGLVGAPIIVALARSIRKLQARLASITRTMHETSGGLSDSSQSLAESSTQAAAAIQQSVSAMTQMTAMLSQTTRNAVSTTQLSREVLDQSQSGVRVMEEMLASMRTISESSSRLREIVQVIQDISAKTNVINDVVFKTQLLAVNASIEAARAGHHGKGFSVVASEVASLATLSGKASSEIRDLLHSSSTRVVDIIEETSNSIREGSSVCNRSSEAFSQIAKSVTAISDKVELISAASREQEAGVAQTSTALNHMNQATSSTNAMAQRNAKLGKEISNQAINLKQIDKAMFYIVTGRDEATAQANKAGRFASHVDRILAKSLDVESAEFAPVSRGKNPKVTSLAARFGKNRHESERSINADLHESDQGVEADLASEKRKSA